MRGATGGDRGAGAGEGGVRVDDVTDVGVPAALRVDRVLDVGTGQAGILEGLDGARHVHRLAESGVRDRFAELLSPSNYVPLGAGVRQAASDLDQTLDPRDTCQAVVDLVRDRLSYERGTTTGSTTAADALESGSGVCQDFTQGALALRGARGARRPVRGLGVPGACAAARGRRGGAEAAPMGACRGWSHVRPTNSLGTSAVLLDEAQLFTLRCSISRSHQWSMPCSACPTTVKGCSTTA